MSGSSLFLVPPDDSPPRRSSMRSGISYAQDSFTVDGSTVTVMFLAGEIDMYTDRAVYDALTRLLTVGSDHVVVDLSGVCFCSVGGFGMLVRTARSVEDGGGRFALVSGSARLTPVAALEWPDRTYPRHATVASAIAGIRTHGRTTS